MNCPHCGAHNPEGTTVCSLCGTAFDAPKDVAAAEAAEARAAAVSEPPTAAVEDSTACPACTTVNPAEARFCHQCGASLTEEAAGSATPARQQVLMLAGIGTVLVIALFAVTQFSKQLDAPAPTTLGSSNAPITAPTPLPEDHADMPLPPDAAAQVAALEADVEALDGEAELSKRRELINLLIGVGRVGQAAREQEALAEIEDSPEAWKRAGSLYFDWMETLQDELKPPVAERVAYAYDRVLAIDPADLQARTELATALLNTNNPMRGVQEIQAVLERDSSYVPARFSYAAMLMMIGRVDQAIGQFEYVAANAEAGSPYQAQAERAIEELSAAPAQ